MRTILHCDINNCFASIEALYDPSLRNRPIAVCGDPTQRRGIVLAKSEEAKRCGVKTGDVLWEARQKCPDIVFIPAHYELYVQYSRAIRKYYESLTYRVEPYGIDECWLDLTGDIRRLGLSGMALGDKIRSDVLSQFHLTISVGVSYNKIFAKLGSDYKKPNAVTVFEPSDMKTRIWPLPASDLFGVGRAMSVKLNAIGIRTVGDIARANKAFLQARFGKIGVMLWQYANGDDTSPVCRPEEFAARKSLGHGTTLPYDMTSSETLWPVFLDLATKIAVELRREDFLTQGLCLYVRDSKMAFHQYCYRLSSPTDVAHTIASVGYMVFVQRYAWQYPVHAVGITAQYLEPASQPHQRELFRYDNLIRSKERMTRPVELAMSQINASMGEDTLKRAATLHAIPEHPCGFGRPQN